MSVEAPHPTVTAAILERQAQHRSEKLEAAADAVGKVAGALHRLSDAVGADDAELADNFRDQVRLFGGRAADALAPLVDSELVARLRRAAESGAATAAPPFPSSSAGGESGTTSASVAPPLSPSNSGEVGRIVAAHLADSPTNPGEVDHPLHGSASASPAEIARIVTARRRDRGATS